VSTEHSLKTFLFHTFDQRSPNVTYRTYDSLNSPYISYSWARPWIL